MKLFDREVVLKALVGSHNYGLAEEEDVVLEDGFVIKASDKDYKAFVIPTFDDLYHGKKFSKQTVSDSVDVDVHDIRKLTDLFFKANVNFLEVLASKELIIPEGNPEIEKIVSLKKEIFKMNLPHLYNACKGMYHNKMSLLHKGTEGTQYLVDQFDYDTKQAQHAYRTQRVIVDFEATDFEDFEGALQYTGEDLEFMKSIKRGDFRVDIFENFNKHYYESTFVHLEKKYKEQPVNLELKAELEDIVMQLIKRKLLTNA
jgi:uncharacterized protein